MPSYKLRYFPIRARGEVARQLFALSGTPFEDERIPMDKWPALKNTTPFGQLPVLEVDGVEIAQSKTICRYLARQFGFAGKCKIEEALVDALLDQFDDYFNEIRPYFAVAAGFAPGDKEALYAEKVVPGRGQFFEYLHNFLDKSMSGYLVGSGLTFVDLFVVEHLTVFEGFHPGYMAGDAKLKALVDKVVSTPALAKWIETRPATPF